MKRDLAALTEREHDLVVVGGGIFGACVAWDAALRGLSVALIERGDFGQAASATNFKIVHGGVRYVQHADLPRLRESVRERRSLLRVAPHLVRPLPIVIPTYGHGLAGPEILRAGLAVYDLFSADRNRGLRDPAQRIPRARGLSREACLALVPGVEWRGLTGGALFHDAQMYSPARLVLAFLVSAVRSGATAANYLEAIGFLKRRAGVAGVVARDCFTGDEVVLRARLVINAAGPWAEPLLARALGLRLDPPSRFSRDLCLVTSRPAPGPCGLAVQGRTRDPDAILARKARHLFLVPWRGRLLLGVWHRVWEAGPEELAAEESELLAYLSEANQAHPALGLGPDEVTLVQAGLVLFGANRPGAVDLSYGKRSRLVDHVAADRLEGLVTVIGVRYTTARGVAARAVDLACRKLGIHGPPSRTETTPLHGGDFEQLDELLQRSYRGRPAGVGVEAARALIRNHGTEAGRLLEAGRRDPALLAALPGSHVLAVEVAHAAREEMAVKLSDVVFRRTDLGTLGDPGDAALSACVQVLSRELGWDAPRVDRELEDVRETYRRLGWPARGRSEAAV